MLRLGLEMVYPPDGPQVKWRRLVDIICVHDIGAEPSSAWHHDRTGKTWISDPDFLGNLKDFARVWAYSYNSDPAANMNSASIGLHANELLGLLVSAYFRTGGGPTIFIAHGFGGLIVKKAVLLYHALGAYGAIKESAAGIVFLGTPHHTRDTDALLTAVKMTVALRVRPGSSPSLDELREYAEVVREVNEEFEQSSRKLELVGFWEQRPTNLSPARDPPYLALIVPEECGRLPPSQGKSYAMDRSHAELCRFPSDTEAGFRKLKSELDAIVNHALADCSDRPIMMLPPPSRAPVRLPRPDPSSEPRPHPGPAPPIIERERPRSRRRPERTGERRESTFLEWIDKKNAEDAKVKRESFIRSLGGWTEANFGNELHPMPGTCTWIQSHSIFRSWADSPYSESLFLPGDAGCGKSHLAKSVASYLLTTRPSNRSIVLSYFCNVAETGQKKPPILEFFISELMRLRPPWHLHVPVKYQCIKPGDPALTLGSLADILRCLKKEAGSGAIFMIVDGINECDTNYTREFLRQIESLVDIIGQESPPSAGPSKEKARLKFLFTCCSNEMTLLASANASRISIKSPDVQKDISTFVDKTMARFRAVKFTDGSIDSLADEIKETAGSFFYFASFSFAELEATTKGTDSPTYGYCRMRCACPGDLGRYYDHDILPLIQSTDNQNYALDAMLIIISANGKLGMTTILDAMSSLYGDPDVKRLDLLAILSQKCSRLVVIGEENIVSVSHSSLPVHFESYLPRAEQHANMAAICVKYLSQDAFAEPLPLYQMGREAANAFMSSTHPFLNYAVDRWRVHLALSGEAGRKLLPQLKKFLAEDSPNYQVWCHTHVWMVKQKEDCANFTIPPIIALTPVNATSIIHEFVPKSWQYPLNGLTPWLQARALVQKGLNPFGKSVNQFSPTDDVRDFFGQTPLMIAAIGGRLEMLRVFVKYPIDINARTFRDGATALLLACQWASRQSDPLDEKDGLDMVRELLEAGADPNIPGLDGGTALHYVCSAGKSRIVSQLLKFGANPNAADLVGYTVLEQAFAEPESDTVEILIEYGVDLEAIFSRGNSPLNCAIADNSFQLFVLLINKVNINELDKGGMAAIHLLAEPQYADWLPYLLRRKDVKVDILSDCLSKDGSQLRWTALVSAVNYRSFTSARLLLEAGADPGWVPGLNSDPPLYKAVKREMYDMAELLLEYQAPVNELIWSPKSNSSTGKRTPLVCAVSKGNEHLVRLLLKNGADPTIEEAYGLLGALDCAVHVKNINIARLLLQHRIPPSVNYIPKGFEHILIEASEKADLEMLRLLVDHGADTELLLASDQKCTPLYAAADNGVVEVCDFFIKLDPRMIDHTSEVGPKCETPLHCAARNGHKEVVRRLLDAGAESDKQSFHYEETPLFSACVGRKLDVVKMLYEASPGSLNTTAYDDASPLMVACRNGDIKTARFLLENGADIKQRDSTGKSCVSSCFVDDDAVPYKMIDLLLEHGLGLNDVVHSRGFTVLGEAVRWGNIPAIRFLLKRGADPTRCQQAPGSSISWRSAVYVAVMCLEPESLNVLLEHESVASYINNLDWHNSTALHAYLPSQMRPTMISKIYWACERLREDTGWDHFSDMLSTQGFTFQTPLDLAIKSWHGKLSPEAVPQLRSAILQLVLRLAPVFRTFHEHLHMMEELALCLMQLPGHDEQAGRLLQCTKAADDVEEDDQGYKRTVVCIHSCDDCSDMNMEVMNACRYCFDTVGDGCRKKREEEGFHEHDYLRVPLVADRDMNSREVQAILQSLKEEFLGLNKVEEDLPERPFKEDPASTATTLSLAFLHAFGYLEFRRKAWRPYHPLASAVELRIQPWEETIQPQRQLFEERLWETELSSRRLADELDYFLGSGIRTAYIDVEVVRSEHIIMDVGNLFDGRLDGEVTIELVNSPKD